MCSRSQKESPAYLALSSGGPKRHQGFEAEKQAARRPCEAEPQARAALWRDACTREITLVGYALLYMTPLSWSEDLEE